MHTIKIVRRPQIVGWWTIKRGNKVVGTLCQTNLAVELGLLPTKDEILSAAKDLGVEVGPDSTVRIIE